MTEAMIFAFTFVLFVAGYRTGVAQSKKRLAARFESRKENSIDEFYDLFYKSSGIDKTLIQELLEHVAGELDLPVARLIPSDRFDVELAPDKGWEYGAGHGILRLELKKWAKQKELEIDISSVHTLDEYLRLAASVY